MLPVTVTGLGVVAPNGLGTDEYWSAILDGRSGLRRIERFDPEPYATTVAGEVVDFPVREMVPGRLRPQTDRTTQFSLAGAAAAVADADLAVDPEAFDVGVITANGCGGFEFGQRELQRLWAEGPHRVSAYQSFAWFYAVNTGQLSIRHGARGFGSVVVSEQAGGLDALGLARRRLSGGAARAFVVAGMDAPLCPWGMAAQLPNGRMSTESDPGRAYLPFDEAAAGYVPGEGGAVLVVEPTPDGTPGRGYGRIVGYAATFDPSPGSGRPSTLAGAVRGALRDAGLEAGDIDVVLADAGGCPDLDDAEADALVEVFGPAGVPVTVPKTMTGRLYAGGAMLDVATALLMLRDGVIPAAANVASAASRHELDLVVAAARHAPIDAAMVLARGIGGFNSALVLRGV